MIDLAAGPEEVLAVVGDLATYPGWLDLVRSATPAAPARAERDEADDRPAWDVELRGRVGPLARSKRLRMVRTRLDGEGATFERAEALDGSHAAWTLVADVEPAGDGSRLTMRLHYGGSLWGPVLDRVLADAVARARQRLPGVVAGT